MTHPRTPWQTTVPVTALVSVIVTLVAALSCQECHWVSLFGLASAVLIAVVLLGRFQVLLWHHMALRLAER